MKTDALVYEVLQTFPECYFELIGASGSIAAEYTFTAEEIKQASLRLDGVLVPARPELPVHFVEVFFYKTAQAYADLFAKVFWWLKTKNPAQEWHASLILASRRLEPAQRQPYRALLASDQVTRIYLDELPPAGDKQVGLGILELLVAPAEQTLPQARTWLERARRRKMAGAMRRRAIELIETVVLGHFPGLSRKELERMIKIQDFRETKVYQEARAEGREEGREEGRVAKSEEIAVRLLAKGLAAAEVAEVTGLSIQRVRALKKQRE